MIILAQAKWAETLCAERHAVANGTRWAEQDGVLKLAHDYSRERRSARRFFVIGAGIRGAGINPYD